MVLVPHEGAVQELATASPDPAFGDRVHAGRPHVAQHSPFPSVHQDRVEDVGEVRFPVADHEFHPLCLSAKVHKQVAGLLGGPLPQSETKGPDGGQGRVFGRHPGVGGQDCCRGGRGHLRAVSLHRCLPVPGIARRHTATAGASSFVNLLTALGMVETMRREGHSAIVLTAAASNLGQMLNKLCLEEHVPLVNIVRNTEQEDLLRAIGAVHVWTRHHHRSWETSPRR